MYADMQMTWTELGKKKYNLYLTIYDEAGKTLSMKTYHEVTMPAGMHLARTHYLAVTGREAAAAAHAAGVPGPEGQLEMFPEHPDWE